MPDGHPGSFSCPLAEWVRCGPDADPDAAPPIVAPRETQQPGCQSASRLLHVLRGALPPGRQPSVVSMPGSTSSTWPLNSEQTNSIVASFPRRIPRWVSSTRLTPVRVASAPTEGPSRWAAPGVAWARPERDLGQERVARANQRIDVRCPAAVARVDEASATTGGRDPEREAVRDVVDSPRGDRQRPHFERHFIERLQVEGSRTEVLVGMQGIEPMGEIARADEAHPPRRCELPTQVVPHRNEVDEVVRMKVADHDRVERARVDRPGQPGERALPEIEQEPGIAVRDQIGRTHGTRSVGVRRSRTDHGEVERVRAGVHAPRVLVPSCSGSRPRAPAGEASVVAPAAGLALAAMAAAQLILASRATVLILLAAASRGWCCRLRLRRGISG